MAKKQEFNPLDGLREDERNPEYLQNAINEMKGYSQKWGWGHLSPQDKSNISPEGKRKLDQKIAKYQNALDYLNSQKSPFEEGLRKGFMNQEEWSRLVREYDDDFERGYGPLRAEEIFAGYGLDPKKLTRDVKYIVDGNASDSAKQAQIDDYLKKKGISNELMRNIVAEWLW